MFEESFTTNYKYFVLIRNLRNRDERQVLSADFKRRIHQSNI